MAGKAIQIQVGGIGIAAGSPFTAGHYALITSGVPPVVADGRLQQLGDAGLSIIAPDVAAPADTTVFVLGDGARSPIAGAGLKRVIIGNLVLGSGAAASTGQVLIGSSINAGATNPNCGGLICIGDAITMAQGGGGNQSHAGAVLIGQNITTSTGTTFDSVVAIGQGANPRSGSGICIGGLTTTGTDSVSIGKSAGQGLDSNVAIGASAKAGLSGVSLGLGAGVGGSGTDTIIIGRASSASAANSIIIGRSSTDGGFSDSIGIGHTVVVGQASNCLIGSNTHPILRCLIGAGYTTNFAGLSLEFTSTAAGSNAAAANTLVKGGLNTGNAVGGEVQFHSGTVLGSGSTYQGWAERFAIVPTLGTAGRPGVRFNGVTTSPGASLGTLTNAPAAGDPGFWLPVFVGATRYGIPCWALP